MKPRYGRPNPPRLNDTNSISTRTVVQDLHIDLNCYPFALKNAAWRRWENGRFAPKPIDGPSDLRTATDYASGHSAGPGDLGCKK